MGVVKHLQLWPKILKNQLLITLHFYKGKQSEQKRETSKKKTLQVIPFYSTL